MSRAALASSVGRTRFSEKLMPRLAPLSQEGLDRVVDLVARGDLGEDDALVLLEGALQVLHELARAVGRLDLPVGEDVHARQDLLLEELDAAPRVVAAPVVSVREVEGIDVPLLGGEALVDEAGAELVGRAD